MLTSLRSHWPEYLMEGAELGIFMAVAGSFATLFNAPVSPVVAVIPSSFLRSVMMGCTMGITAISVIYSPWGKRSGAHFNPAVTLAFYRLGKLQGWDALFYVLAQFVGGLAGILLVAAVLGEPFTSLPVHYIVTIPGAGGWLAALVAEFVLASGLMLAILVFSNHDRLHERTGIFAGMLVALFIIVGGPISGMSINPARTFASALPAHVWTAFWVYYAAPPAGMLLAAEFYLQRSRQHPKTLCGKLCPNAETRCICLDCPCQDMPTPAERPQIDPIER
ncbi:MAG: aquaporin [Cyanobacteria bacterium J06639_1]